MSVRTLLKVSFAFVGTVTGGGLFLAQTRNEYCWNNISLPLIRKLDAESAHVLAVKVASLGLVPKFITKDEDKSLLDTSVFGLKFESPVGLAAGFDKDAECFAGMLKMGFSFVEVGSITPLPQPGNAKPRVFRLYEDCAVINRYGFNSRGIEHASKNLVKYHSNGVVGINLGKNKTSTDACADYVEGIEKLGGFADYLVINVSSPNTPGLRSLQGKQALSELLTKALEKRGKLKNKPPLLVKIAPDLTVDDKKDIADVILNEKTRVDGIIISNTTIKRPDSLKSLHKNETGGLSGRPLKDFSTNCIRDMYLLTKGEIPIIGVGGVTNGQDAFDKICNGASLVQLYTSLSICGPPVVKRVKEELADILRNKGFTNIQQAVGTAVPLPKNSK